MASEASPIAKADEAGRFPKANPGVRSFELVFTNLSGVPRGKRLRRHEVMAVFDEGRFLPGSVLVCDITGRDGEETGLVWGDGDAARAAWLGRSDLPQVRHPAHQRRSHLRLWPPGAVVRLPALRCEARPRLHGQGPLLRLPADLGRRGGRPHRRDPARGGGANSSTATPIPATRPAPPWP